MEQLIQRLIGFVMDHYVIVVIVVGLIYTMFFRKSPLETPRGDRPVRQSRPSDRMPDFGGSPVFPSKPRQSGAPAQRPAPVEHREPLSTETVRPAANQSIPTAIPLSTLISASEDIRGEPIRVTHDELTRAVVWAEILGPPRSRRPYRR